MKTESKPREVRTERGHVLELGAEIGRGGQGAVYRVVDRPALLVKLSAESDPAAAARLRDRIEFVSLLPLDGLAIAKPEEVLAAPDVGYVMRLVPGEFTALSALTSPADPGDVAEDFVASGGLRRRLAALEGVASRLGELHSLGLAFGDVSPNNGIVASDGTVWLIDTDNVHFSSDAVAPIYTPGFGAPEVVRGLPPDSLSDAFSFATLAWSVLTWSHPYVGDAVDEGPPEFEEAAYRGELPWILDPGDDSNRTDRLIPPDTVLTAELLDLAHRTFGPGRDQRTTRPGVGAWRSALRDARLRLLTCQCGWEYAPREEECPACTAARPPFLLVALHGIAAIDDVRESFDRGLPKIVVGAEPVELDETTLLSLPAPGDTRVSLRVHEGDRAAIRWTGDADVELILSGRLHPLARNTDVFLAADQLADAKLRIERGGILRMLVFRLFEGGS